MSAATWVYRYLLIGLTALFLFTSGARLYQFFHQRDDIWWTPRGMTIPLEAGHHRVTVYLRGKELDDLIARRQVLLQDQAGTSAVSRTEVGLRFNNWDRVRAEKIPGLLISAATLGAAAALLLVGLVTRGDHRGG
jgi:hypothetical protein